MKRGIFITFEGGEGTGKSTQAALLARRLEACGRDVVLTREPGGSTGAEAIRALLVEGRADRWSAVSEALLLYAARCDHIERRIGPALATGKIVVCDRFADSTRAYQGAGGGAPAGLLEALEMSVLDGLEPDLTLILDLPVETGLARARARGAQEGRFEAKGKDFHERLRLAFVDLASRAPERCRLIDARGRVGPVARKVWSAVAEKLALTI